MSISRNDLQGVLKGYHVKNKELIATKVDKESGKGLSTNDYTTAEKTKLSGITAGAQTNQNAFSNVKVGTVTISADSPTDTFEMVAGSNITITADSTNDKVTIASTNTTYNTATTAANGLMSSVDKTKLDGIDSGANNYVHPDTTSIRHVTDTEKNTWNAKETTAGSQAKADKALADAKTYTNTKVADLVASAPEALDTLQELSAALGDDPNFATTVMEQIGSKVDKESGKGLSTNDFTSAEKAKLAGIAAGANIYTHPTTSGNKHIPSGGSTGQILRWSADGTAVWGSENNTTYILATTTANGLMSSADKVKLDGIATGATNTANSATNGNITINGNQAVVYTHPTGAGNNHIPAGGATGQILRWGSDGTASWGAENNTTYVVATTIANGLMSSTDKIKLDGIAAGATNTVLNNTVTSTSTTQAATANAVKMAYDIGNHTHPYAPISHNHNDIYYTETEMDSKLSTTLASAKTYTDTKIAAENVDMTTAEITAMINEILV